MVERVEDFYIDRDHVNFHEILVVNLYFTHKKIEEVNKVTKTGSFRVEMILGIDIQKVPDLVIQGNRVSVCRIYILGTIRVLSLKDSIVDNSNISLGVVFHFLLGRLKIIWTLRVDIYFIRRIKVFYPIENDRLEKRILVYMVNVDAYKEVFGTTRKVFIRNVLNRKVEVHRASFMFSSRIDENSKINIRTEEVDLQELVI